MGSRKDALTSAYLKNKSLRVFDPIVKRRKKIKAVVDRRAKKGEAIVKKVTSKLMYNPKKRRQRR